MWLGDVYTFEIVNNSTAIILQYFHYPNGKSKEYTRLRQETTDKYGDILTWILLGFILAIPLQKLLIVNGFTLSGKLPLFKIINLYLNKTIKNISESDLEMSNSIRKIFYQSKVKFASFIKKWIFIIYYHLASIMTICFWVITLGILSLNESYKGDLIFVAKRLGRLCAICLPTVLFLSLRPSPLPHTLYLALLPIHKWLSRIIILQALLHTILYCGFFQKNGTWAKAWKLENLYGWIALLGFIAIIITSLSKIRNKFYRAFYFNHYFWTWVIVICLQFHVRPVAFTKGTILNLSILFGQVLYRLKLTKVTSSKFDFKVINVSPNLSYIEFPNHLISNPALNPGAHIRITEYSSSIIERAFKQLIPNHHPYTLVSLPHDNYQKLIVRRSNFAIQNYHKYIIYGSFDPHLLFIKSKNEVSKQFSISKLVINAKKILIVIGGSAISFALPILRIMNYHGVRIKIVWVIKDFRDVSILKYFDGFVHGDDFEIFVTGDMQQSQQRQKQTPCVSAIPLGKYGSASDNNDYNNDSGPIFMSSDLESQPSGELDPLLFDSSHHGTTSIDSNDNEQDSSKTLDMQIEDEREDVEISIDQDEEEEEGEENLEYNDCARPDCSLKSTSHNDNGNDDNDDDDDDDDDDDGANENDIANWTSNSAWSGQEQSFNDDEPSNKTQRSSLTNEAFMPTISLATDDNLQIEQFKEVVKRLNLEHKIYKGRPKLNFRYYNWCTNEEDIFTQCSGPVEDETGMLCCRDLPRRNLSNQNKKLTPDSSRCWVVSAGPKGLVKNVKLWANENGLKFHEEAFYV